MLLSFGTGDGGINQPSSVGSPLPLGGGGPLPLPLGGGGGN